MYAGETSWPPGLSEATRTQLLQIPRSLPPEIHALAAELTEGHETTAAKAAAITDFFHTNFEYQLGIKIPEDQDPMPYFLLERPPAHCEYFASGAALLLRISGVPCRYVTGFVAVERNASGGYWMARNRDAHAWVEAYDAERGWFIVEATPAAGVPDGDSSSRWAYAWDSFKHRLSRMRHALTLAGLADFAKRTLSSVLHSLTATPLAIFCAVILLAIAAAFTLRRRRTKPSQPKQYGDETRASLRKLLSRVDRRLLKKGIIRHATQTLHAHVKQLQKEHPHDVVITATAAWYIKYAHLIYSAHPTNSDIERLKNEIP